MEKETLFPDRMSLPSYNPRLDRLEDIWRVLCAFGLVWEKILGYVVDSGAMHDWILFGFILEMCNEDRRRCKVDMVF